MPVGDIATTKQFVNGQLGIDGVDLNAIIGQSSIQPSFYSAQSPAAAPGDSDYLLLLSAGGTYEKVLYSNFFGNQKFVQQALLPFVSTIINGDMSVWQWGTSFTNPATASYLADRFRADYVLGGGGKINAAQQVLSGSLQLPNGYTPLYALRISVNTVQASLAVSDTLTISQRIELSQANKLFPGSTSGLTSLQIWVRVNNAGTYSVFLQNANQSQTYKQDFNIGTPNVWTQLTLPAIAAFPTGSGTWGTNQPDWSYTIGICLGAGTNFQDSTQSQWQGNNHVASSSTTNFLATSGNTIDLCLAQHEMGPLCTTFRPDASLAMTLLKCQRYFSKSYQSGIFAGTASTAGECAGIATSAAGAVLVGTFPTTMRVAPTVTVYKPSTGASGAADGATTASPSNVGDARFTIIAGSGMTAGGSVAVHFTANAEL
jgi:hypothetical protein